MSYPTERAIHYESQVRVEPDRFEIRLTAPAYKSLVFIDRATASRLIKQLQEALEYDWNRTINERPDSRNSSRPERTDNG